MDTAAVDFLSQQHHLPINEAPHSSEHSIENQLPFLLHGASCGWDLAAAGCGSSEQPGKMAEAAASQAGQAAAPATLSIVPISVGYLGNQLHMIQSVGGAVRDVLQHLKRQQVEAGSSSGSSEAVLIVTSDFTHAGPWYRELPPAGVTLEDYMRRQDTPVLQVGSPSLGRLPTRVERSAAEQACHQVLCWYEMCGWAPCMHMGVLGTGQPTPQAIASS